MSPLGPDNDPVFTFVTDKEGMIRLRDTEQRSWAAIAKEIGLGSPGAARRLYSTLVRPHTESVLTVRNKSDVTPVQLDGMDLDGLRDAITGHTIVVERKTGNEDIPVDKVTSLKDGTLNFSDGTKARSVKVSAIVAVK